MYNYELIYKNLEKVNDSLNDDKEKLKSIFTKNIERFVYIPDFEKHHPKYKTLKIGNKIFKYVINAEKYITRKSMQYTSKTVKV